MPYVEAATTTDLVATSERDRFLRDARMRQEIATQPDEQGRFTITRLLEVEDFKYRHLRVEESWVRDPATGEEKRVGQHVMVADHFLVTLRPEVQEAAFEELLAKFDAKVRRRLPNS